MMTFLGKASAVVFGTMLCGGAIAYSDGSVDICVKEKQRNGHQASHIHLPPLPALAGPVLMHMLPKHRMHRPRNLEQWLPAIRIAGQELERCPDGTTLVQVESDRENVKIVKSGGNLVIDVDSPRETVHVAFPIRTVVSMIAQLESTGPAI